MGRLVGLCVRHAGAIATLTLVALLAGVWAMQSAPLDVFPEFVPSTVDIQTEAPGFTAEQVEQLITKPIENAVNGATGLSTIRSDSIPGLSVINIQFKDGINLYNARQGISERLSELGSAFPSGVGEPKLSPLTSSTMDLLKIGLVSDKLNAFDLRGQADWVMVPALLAVPGVAHVIVFGGSVKQIQIQPDVARMNAYGFTLTDISDAARAALSLRGAGFIDMKAQRVLIQTPVPQADPKLIAAAVLAVRGGVPVTIGDIATVKIGAALKSGDALIQGRPGILLSLASQYGANTLETTRAVEDALAQLKPGLAAQGITLYETHRPANFIEDALRSLERSLVIAAVLILAVLYLFLRDWRSALITFMALPLSLLAATSILEAFGQTLNTMTLGGFAVALGVLVDDAIIGIENILHRLHDNARHAHPRPRLNVIAEATMEVRKPVVYATLVVIAVFLPQLFSTSVQGHFTGPMALSFMLAVIASMLVSITATPALSALFLKLGHDAHHDSGWIAGLKSFQARAVLFCSRFMKPIGAVLIVATLASVAVLPFLGGSFMPDFREGHFVMQVDASTPGVSLEEMADVGKRLSAELLALPYIATVSDQLGRAAMGEDTSGTHQTEFHVELKPDADIDQAEAEDKLREIATHYPGIQTDVRTFLGDRIDESLTGETADVAIKVYGDDLDQLDSLGHQIVGALTGTPGIADLQFKSQSGTPTLALQLNQPALAASGLKIGDVLDAVDTGYAGTTVGQTYVGTNTVDVVLILPDAARAHPEQLSSLMINGPFGPVPLSQVTRISPTATRYSVSHDGGLRYVAVTFNVPGGALQATEKEAQTRIAQKVKLPQGFYLEFTGAAAEQRAAETQQLIFTGFALILIAMILFICFRWRVHSWLVLVNLPFSLIGAVIAILLTGEGLSLGAMVGLVTVFGVSARNGILLLDHYEHLVEQEGAEWTQETIFKGAQQRLVPILMTAVVTALGLLPLAIGMHQPGQEIEGPMAVTVLGGLITSTLLNLVLLPALAQRYGGPGEANA
jgi:CzcA family heavy metal efflux pump